MENISQEKLEKYFEVTKKALEKAVASKNRTNLEDEREDFLDMIKRYVTASSTRHLIARKSDEVIGEMNKVRRNVPIS